MTDMNMVSMDKDVWIVGEEVNFTLNLEEYMENYTYTNEGILNIYLIKDWSKFYERYTISQLDNMNKLIRFNSSLYGINYTYQWGVNPSSSDFSSINDFERTHIITDSDKNIETLTPIIFITSSYAQVVSLNTNPISDFITDYPDSYIICDSLNITINSNVYWLMKDLYNLWGNNNIEYGFMESYNSPTLLCRCSKINKLSNGTLFAFHIDPNINLSDTTDLMLKLRFRNGEFSTSYPIYGKINSTYSRELIPISVNDLIVGGVLLLLFNGNDRWIALNFERGTSLADNIYPVGSIYMSVNSTNPSALFGGTWEQIKDTFLLATGDTYENGSTGGSATVTLTSAQSGVPAHSHKYQDYNTTYTLKTTNRKPGTSTAVAYGTSLTSGGGATERTSSNNTAVNASQAHENMPPYFTVYMWKRVA